MNILFATSEVAPYSKTGGLGDVAAALPAALAAAGHHVRVLTPAYPALLAAFPDAPVISTNAWLGGDFPGYAIREARTADGMVLWLLDCRDYFDRPGNPYTRPDGSDWPDNPMRFGLLARVAAWLSTPRNDLDFRPDVLHCNDWQTALAPVYLRHGEPGAKTLLTLHNMAFQGHFDLGLSPALALPPGGRSPAGAEFHGGLNYLKGGILCADRITTVSPTYAAEIQTPAFGFGLDGLLRHRAADLSGILNGIDDSIWNPANDPLIPAPYSAEKLTGKAKNRKALLKRVGLPERAGVPVLGVVSRLTHQKGLDWLAALGERLPQLPAQLVLLGKGEAGLENAFQSLMARHPESISATLGYDEGMAHLIEAGADLFIMPSRFEPCGLNQMYSLRYGTLPLVRATGGLADTVIDASAENLATRTANGFVFTEDAAEALFACLQRALALWPDTRRWRALQRTAMRTPLGWNQAAGRYTALYEALGA
jgi:starch synthase